VLRRIVLVVLGVQAGVIAIVVLAANQQWAELVIPSEPWSHGQRLVTFEVQVWALVVFSFVLGAALTLLVARNRRGRGTATPPEESPWPTDRDRPV
jgi:heme/copper-type cytochrome/quinol oxidase subunit 2